MKNPSLGELLLEMQRSSEELEARCRRLPDRRKSRTESQEAFLEKVEEKMRELESLGFPREHIARLRDIMVSSRAKLDALENK